MQKIQVLFPGPQMDALRRLAKIEDRPVSEIVRRAVDRDLEQREALLRRGTNARPTFPTFDGGAVRVPADELKRLLYADDDR